MEETQEVKVSPQKQWQVEVFTSEDQEAPHVFYGKSLVELREQVYSWLMNVCPTYIRSGEHSDTKNQIIRETTYWKSGRADDETVYKQFCKNKLSIQKGPDFEEQGFVDGTLRLEYIRKVENRRFNRDVNEMLQRGWYILALEKSEVARDTTETYYVLGHTEPDAF